MGAFWSTKSIANSMSQSGDILDRLSVLGTKLIANSTSQYGDIVNRSPGKISGNSPTTCTSATDRQVILKLITSPKYMYSLAH